MADDRNKYLIEQEEYREDVLGDKLEKAYSLGTGIANLIQGFAEQPPTTSQTSRDNFAKAAFEDTQKFLSDIGSWTTSHAYAEKAAMDRRLAETRFMNYMNSMGVQLGYDGSQAIAAKLSEQETALVYALDELQTNPRAYMARKKAQIQESIASLQQIGALAEGLGNERLMEMSLRYNLGSALAQFMGMLMGEEKDSFSLEGYKERLLQMMAELHSFKRLPRKQKKVQQKIFGDMLNQLQAVVSGTGTSDIDTGYDEDDMELNLYQ